VFWWGRFLFKASGRCGLCEKCKDIDDKMARYRRLSRAVNDKPVMESLDRLIADLELEKAALHPNPGK
jgi:hypothetical protein